MDQSSLMRQFMTSFSRNMKKAILEDSRGDMDEGERLRQLDALQSQDNEGEMPRAGGDDDADRLSQGLEPRSWSHGQPAAAPRALEEFASDLQRGLSGPPREYEPHGPPREYEPHMHSRERVGLLNGRRHHSHRAIPPARSAAVATALFLVAPTLLL